jgi:Zn-dependent membrane protease YugP
MKIRAMIIPITNIGSSLAMPLILLGILFAAFEPLITVGILCFSLSVIFQLVTLPVEFNASRRAMMAIENAGILTDDEQKGARKTLTAAAMTYVAATIVAAAQLLRLILLFGRRRRN